MKSRMNIDLRSTIPVHKQRYIPKEITHINLDSRNKIEKQNTIFNCNFVDHYND